MTTDIYKGMDNKQLCFYRPDLDMWNFLELQKNEPLFWEKYQEYCEVDCISLLEVWRNFKLSMKTLIKQMGEYTNKDSKHSDGGWLDSQCNVNSSTTVGGLAKKCLVKLNEKNLYRKQYDLFMNDDHDKYRYIKQFKRGGISFVQYQGKHDYSISIIDIVSQYPSAFMHMKIPTGSSHWIQTDFDVTSVKWNEHYKHLHGFYLIKNLQFKQDNKFRPIAIKTAGKSLNWKADWSKNKDYELPIDSEMIKFLMEHDDLVQFDIISGLCSKEFILGRCIFQKFVSSLFGEKQKQDTYKSNGDSMYNEAIRSSTKLTLNSLSGKLVEDPCKYFSLSFRPTDHESDAKHQINQIEFHKNYDEKINPWLMMGVMVYSYSKRHLFNYINHLPNKSDDVLACETDSIFVKKEHAEYLESYCKNTAELQSYQAYPCFFSAKLGGMEYELTTNQPSYILEKKCYCLPYLNVKTDAQDYKIKCKGIPTKTIDKDGKHIQLLTPDFYNELYAFSEVKRCFRSVFHVSKGAVQVGCSINKRTVRASSKYCHYS
jgi:hypothetical protein